MVEDLINKRESIAEEATMKFVKNQKEDIAEESDEESFREDYKIIVNG